MELGVASAKDLSHSACADRRNDFVDTETAAGRERQRSGLYERTAELTSQRERRRKGRGECHFELPRDGFAGIRQQSAQARTSQLRKSSRTPSQISLQNNNLRVSAANPCLSRAAAPDDFHPRFRYDRLSIADRIGANRERNRERNRDPIGISRVDSADRGNACW